MVRNGWDPFKFIKHPDLWRNQQLFKVNGGMWSHESAMPRPICNILQQGVGQVLDAPEFYGVFVWTGYEHISCEVNLSLFHVFFPTYVYVETILVRGQVPTEISERTKSVPLVA